MLFKFPTKMAFVIVAHQEADLAHCVKLGAEQFPGSGHFQVIDIFDRGHGEFLRKDIA